MGRKHGEVFRCGCGEQCVMAAHHESGKLNPITVKAYDGGNIETFQATDNGPGLTYRIVPKQEREADPKPRPVSHFSNCPHVGDFRR